MSSVNSKVDNNIAVITLNRPKVNALNDQLIRELKAAFQNAQSNDFITAIILTGEGSFFSFGFDVPEFMAYPKSSFESYVINYSKLIKEIFLFPKPVIAALNGHTVAGGCVLALACDHRVMLSGKAKIALNEMTFGSSLFSCVTETLQYAVGAKNSERIVYSGKMHSAEEALSLGLIDKIANEDEFLQVVSEIAQNFAKKDTKAFASIKKMLKQETLNRITNREQQTISEFVDIWYSDSTRKQLAKIEIRD
ncbi:MAG: putative enoyl-CoA hydratase [Thermodesulfobacteriota bacterium]|nr:MAG: putative enoyl-CoA hydratase [Thermodesulfobacteriota bacterium]